MQSSIFEISVMGIHIAPKWYGLMYGLGFIVCYHFTKKWSRLSQKDVDALLFFVFLGVVLGGRIGYTLLYNPIYFFSHPIEVLRIWEGGMSFHGGLIGVIVAIFAYAKIYKKRFFFIIDTVSVSIPIAIGLGRIGNWINGELLGFSPYNGPFAMIQNERGHFPSPLFEMFGEGIVLFCIMFFFFRRVGPFDKRGEKNSFYREGFLSGVFLLGYSLIRIVSELFRLPDQHIGYLLQTDWVTLGMLYTLPMLIGGIYLVVFSGSKVPTMKGLLPSPYLDRTNQYQ